MGLNTLTTFRLDIERVAHILDLDEYKINEAKKTGKSTMISLNSLIKNLQGAKFQ